VASAQPLIDTAAADAAAGAVFTVPNAFTMARLVCVPVFVWLLLGHHPHDRWPAAVLLGILGATDWVDGYLARHLHQVSKLGQVLDPAVDRILLASAVTAILIDGSVPVWIAAIVIGREALVAAAVVGLALAGARRMAVQWAGKAGTFGLMFTFPLFLLGHSTLRWHQTALALAWCCAIPALVFSLYAAVTYIPMARRALAEGRDARRAWSATCTAAQETRS
jgi:cardiolipin synthase